MTTNPTSCVSRARPGLNKLVLGVAAALALLGTAPATASVIDFESLSPDGIYLGGGTLTESGYTLQAIDNFGGTSGFVGVLANGMDLSICALGGCPTNNTSHFYMGLNGGSVTVSKNDGGKFSLRSLDFGFVAPTGGQADFSYGQLQLTGNLANGTTVDLALDFPGTDGDNPLFGSAILPTAFGNTLLTSLTMRACLFDGMGGCTVATDPSTDPTAYQRQFAIDNLALAEVPEPGSLALIGLGMGALLSRRRKPAASSNHA